MSLSASQLEELSIMFCCGRPRIGPGERWLLFDFQLSMAKGCSSKHGQGQLPEYVLSLYIGAHKEPANRSFDFEQEVARRLPNFCALDPHLRTEVACLWSTCAAASPISNHHTKAQNSGGGEQGNHMST